MKIAHFAHSNIGISETFIYDSVKGFIDKGSDVTFYSGSSSDKVKSFNVESSVYTGFAENALKVSFLAYKVGKVFGREGFDFKNKVQQLYSFNKLMRLVKELPDVAYIEYATTAVLVVDFLYQKEIPFIVHVHGYDVTAATADPAYVRKLKDVFIKANYIIAPSFHLKRLLVLMGCNEDKIKVIRYGVEFNKINPIPFSQKLVKNPQIIHVGRLAPMKNPIALLYAFKKVCDNVPNAELTIIGDGPLKQAVNDKIAELKLRDSVNVLGARSRPEVYKALQNSWIYAQHSITTLDGSQEGFPVSLIEAGAFELPIVSTIHSGITENVVEGETGFLVQEYDYESMADKIIYLIKNPEIAERMGKSGRKRLTEMCSISERIDEIHSLLISIKK